MLSLISSSPSDGRNTSDVLILHVIYRHSVINPQRPSGSAQTQQKKHVSIKNNNNKNKNREEK